MALAVVDVPDMLDTLQIKYEHLLVRMPLSSCCLHAGTLLTAWAWHAADCRAPGDRLHAQLPLPRPASRAACAQTLHWVSTCQVLLHTCS